MSIDADLHGWVDRFAARYDCISLPPIYSYNGLLKGLLPRPNVCRLDKPHRADIRLVVKAKQSG